MQQETDWAILLRCPSCHSYTSVVPEDRADAISICTEPPSCDACHGPTFVFAVYEQLSVKYLLGFGSDGVQEMLNTQP